MAQTVWLSKKEVASSPMWGTWVLDYSLYWTRGFIRLEASFPMWGVGVTNKRLHFSQGFTAHVIGSGSKLDDSLDYMLQWQYRAQRGLCAESEAPLQQKLHCPCEGPGRFKGLESSLLLEEPGCWTRGFTGLEASLPIWEPGSWTRGFTWLDDSLPHVKVWVLDQRLHWTSSYITHVRAWVLD